MKKILLFLILTFVLTGCSAQKEVGSSEISKNIPDNYELYGTYYENLDDDRENEVILLLQQDRAHITNTEEFKTLPVIIKVLDNKDGIWIASQNRKIEDYSNNFPTNLGQPYKIFKDWIVLKTQSRSFDGVAYGADIFSYSEDLGLFPVIFNSERKRQYALTSLIDKTNKIYLLSCNPWEMWSGMVEEDELKIVTEVIDLNGDQPKIYSMDLDIKCKALDDEFGQMNRIEPDILEKFLNDNGVYL